MIRAVLGRHVACIGRREEPRARKTINETEAKIAGIPAMATQALAKLTASLSGGIST